MLTWRLRCARKEGDYLHRLESAAGSALQPRFAHGGQSAEIHRRLALLKGRSNYLCLERLEQQALAGGDLPVQTLSDVIILRSWSNQTEDGDISTCASVPEDSLPGRW
jgi:Rad3-related DNA helicase